MSKRHKIGDIITKKQNAGFISKVERCIIPDNPENREMTDPKKVVTCWIEWCGDEKCIEWPTLYVLGEDGKPTGQIACHVTDCEMEEVETT